MKQLILLLLCITTIAVHAQQPDWQKAAGDHMSFEVASIKPDDGPFKSPSFALSTDEWFNDPNGHFHADFTLTTYISFAYKFWLTTEESRALYSKLPDWVRTQRFEVQANAPLHTTKDQYRLMMQSLLAERFGLTLHFEQKDLPVLAMTLVKPGKPGPQLTPHEQGPACDTPSKTVFPPMCYAYSARPAENGEWLNGSRATTMELLAAFVGMTGQMQNEIDRRVVDQTGLTGQWDFTLELLPPTQMRKDSTATGPSFLEAIREQLGITLKPARMPVSLPVIDTIQPLSEN
ncbi:TIGR03435 family protein [Terriglobus tenax]|uniref:TIGR03435 family protein n=1 Tax=Terriglobus tenax TaxID=1111115 RepID=UPI0021E07CF1|nr:TIGR03435 family protein [Terriglobus tenax]